MLTQIYVNFWSVLVAAIANMALGFMWYGPLFGKQWTGMMGWTKEQMDIGAAKMQKEGWKTYLPAFIASVAMAWVLGYVIIFASNYFLITGMSMGLMMGFWMWVGFVVPVTLSTVLWEGKSWSLWLLNSGYYLCALVMMGVILSVWM